MADKDKKHPPAKIETANWLSYFSFNWIQPLLIHGWVSSLLPLSYFSVHPALCHSAQPCLIFFYFYHTLPHISLLLLQTN